MDGQGNSERTWKVREFENKWLWQAVFRKFIHSVQEGKGLYFLMRKSKPISLLIGATLKGKNLLPWALGEQILSFKSDPQI